LEGSRELLVGADLASPVRLVVGDVFEPPFGPRTFDLVYSAGLFHELDVRESPAEDALAVLVSVTRPEGRVSTSDFVDSVPAAQL
ncbi:class I SAM-dependent methyltransferase, partial [Lactococcus petauri]|uniref:class I SAM-dependent methyltransferase n=1 Tax=Lactococcus petauri TaxID=1940789 RepID=UPI0021F1ADA0